MRLQQSKKKKISFNEVDINLAKEYAAEDADVTFRLWEKLKELIKASLYDFYFYRTSSN